MAELKPCPFCGGEAMLAATSSCSGLICCVGCGMKTGKFWDEPMSSPEKERTKWHEIATAAWNRREDNG